MNVDDPTLGMISTGLQFKVSNDENDSNHTLSITYPEIVFFPFLFWSHDKGLDLLEWRIQISKV
jgi:hypothetical protein